MQSIFMTSICGTMPGRIGKHTKRASRIHFLWTRHIERDRVSEYENINSKFKHCARRTTNGERWRGRFHAYFIVNSFVASDSGLASRKKQSHVFHCLHSFVTSRHIFDEPPKKCVFSCLNGVVCLRQQWAVARVRSSILLLSSAECHLLFQPSEHETLQTDTSDTKYEQQL